MNRHGLQAYIHLTLGAGLALGIALVVVGMLIAFGLVAWLAEGDEKAAAERAAVEDQALQLAAEVMAPYPGRVPQQRVSNGEGLLQDLGGER